MKPEQRNPLAKKSTAALDALVSPQEGEQRKAPDSADLVRATFIIDRHKLQLLKDHAYTQRKQIKDVVEEMVTEYLNAHFDNDKAINGNTWDQ